MEFEFNSINKDCLFSFLDQGDEDWSKMCCSFYAPAINLKYNCGIKLTEEDIKLIASVQHMRGLFDFKKGGKGSDGIEAVYTYVKENAEERGWDIPNLVKFKYDDKNLNKWILRGYATVIGIKVNKEFYKDARDGVIDVKDYIDLAGGIGHFTNITKWNGRGDDTVSDYGKEMFLDSYFKKDSTYECDINEVLTDLAMPSSYIFFK